MKKSNYHVGNPCRILHYPQLNDDNCFVIPVSDIWEGARLCKLLNHYDSTLREHGFMKDGQSESKLQYYSDDWKWVDWGE